MGTFAKAGFTEDLVLGDSFPKPPSKSQGVQRNWIAGSDQDDGYALSKSNLALTVIETNGLPMTHVSVVKMKQLILATAIALAAFGSASALSNAADYAPVVVPGTKHVRATWYYSDWRDRCAYAGYYCLYAYDGFVYHYRWDDIAYAYGYARRNHSRRVRY